MSFKFGTTSTSTQPSLFGTTPTTQSSGFGGFGSAGTTGGTTGGFALGSFGTTTTTSASTGFGSFGVGTATTSAPSLFSGFGTTSTSASPFSFSTATTSAPSAGFGGFGTTATGGFGSGLGTTGTSSGFSLGGFGSTGGASTFGATGAGTFGAPNAAGGVAANAQNAVPSEEANLTATAMAVSLPQIYGDERDAIIAKWNQLQAYWGTGKGFYSSNGVVEFKPENHFCRFKALGYHLIPKGNNEAGQVALVLAKKETDVLAAQQQIVDTLHKILGSKPTLNICVEGVKSMPEDRTEIVIYVLERPATGPAKRVPASDLFNFLNQPTQKTQVSSQLNVESILPKVGWSDEQLKEYLDKAPSGVDPLLWEQAKLDNPDPEKYIPVPMIGFKELQRRLRHQAEQTKLYQQRLDVIAGDLTDLQTQHSTMLSKLEDCKRKDLELGHRLLKVIVKQEVYRKMGYAIQVEEETLKVQLEQLQGELNHPTQFKGRLNELMSQMRMQIQTGSGRSEQGYNMDTETQVEIKQILKQQQEGLQHLINIIKEDATDLQLIEQGISKTQSR
ncbi:nucleoporin p54 isoform X2 [Aplysia californica]|uniref:Nucleoporin p54 isoform X2 n=1 Tax=Aplysia californica TaxID=6500 RepID=A0ABM0K9J8_APLCA|nr:nucleoporin p54 isoform X2 [Aplysia californica]